MNSAFMVPGRLAKACGEKPDRAAWLQQLPQKVAELRRRWSLDLAAPFGSEGSCTWVAPAVLRSGRRGEVVGMTRAYDDFTSNSQVFVVCVGGWPVILDNLKMLLETGKSLPAFDFSA